MVAQRFSAGVSASIDARVPEGRLKIAQHFFYF
jgi:hypothetical protein